jgi:7-cyano-7-deazaguanine synthase in queuosine biosynthesis
MDFRCIACGEQIDFEEYWSWTCYKGQRKQVRYVCKKCMEEALDARRLEVWSLGP